MQTRQKSRLTQIEERVRRFVDQRIRPCLYRSRVPLNVVHREVHGEPVPFAEGTAGDFAPLAPGDAWGRAWDTVWLRCSARVPDEWAEGTALRAGTRLEADIDLGFTVAQPGFQAEGLAYTLDGQPIKGLSPWNHYLPIKAEVGDVVDFWVEAAANPNVAGSHVVSFQPTPLGLWETAGDELRYRLRAADLVLVDLEVYELLCDIEVLTEVAAQCSPVGPRRWQIAAALERMVNAVDPGDVAGTAARARTELSGVLARPAHASAHTVYASGHAHIDSAWLWPVRETIRKCARTFSNVLSLMDTDPEFVFACSSAQQYAWIKERYPELFERIAQRVAEGRFVPVGGMWVESDTNLPSGEALVRQFTFGQRFFREEFGVTCEEAWLPDSFGYSGALPQIAAGAGARRFFTQKMSWNRVNRMPHHVFRWEGHDGTSLLAHMPSMETYNARLSAEELVFAEENFADHLTNTMSLAPFGWGDGGGGPTREMLATAHRCADLEGVPRVVLSSPADFFDALEAESPAPAIWKGEMYLELHRGTYTSQAATKRGNRRSESLLREAELWATTASVRTGAPYPADILDDAWRKVLLLQFHDILPGSSIAWVHREAEQTYAEVAATLEGVIAASLAALAGVDSAASPHATAAAVPAVVANASPYPRRGVPALGAGIPAGPTGVEVEVEESGDGIVIANGELRVTVDGQGLIVGLEDLAQERSLFSADRPGNLLQLHPDLPTEWDAWDLDDHYRQTTSDLREARVEVSAAGSDAATVTIRREFGASTVVQAVTVRRGEKAVRIATDVDWHERERVLKLAFPLRVDATESSAETQFGFVRRPATDNTSWQEAQFEICAHRWLHVDEGGYGVGIANATTYGHDVVRDHDARGTLTVVRQTLLRAPLFPDPEADQGRHTFCTVLAPGADIARTTEVAYDLAFPLREVGVATGQGGGTAARAGVEPLVSVDGEGVLIDTVKLADDGSGDVVARLYEALGRRGRVAVRASFAHRGVVETNLLEEPVEASLPRYPAAGSPAGDDAAYEGEVRPFQLLTLRFRR